MMYIYIYLYDTIICIYVYTFVINMRKYVSKVLLIIGTSSGFLAQVPT